MSIPPIPNLPTPNAVEPASEPAGFGIWQIMPDESPAHFQAFREYRDMAYPDGYAGAWAKRTYSGCARILKAKYRAAWSVETLRETGDYFRWADRCRAFDLHLDSVASGKLVDEAARFRRKHLRLMAKAAEFGEAELDRHMRRGKNLNRNPKDVIPTTRPVEALDFIERSLKAERLVIGQTTDNPGAQPVQVQVDLSSLSMEELEQLEAIRAKVSPTT